MLLAVLDPMMQPKFVNPLPIPPAMQPTVVGGTAYEVTISQFEQDLGLVDPVTGERLMTTVWGYNGSYPGPTIEARRGTPITVRWVNDLQHEGMPLPHLFPIDTERHWANPPSYPESGVPTVTHLHGGQNESASDGLPEAWFTPGFEETGTDFVKETYYYANNQDPATLWYHDHTLGITSLNVYAGLAGFYNLRDANEDSLNLPKGRYEIPLVIQDRMFSDTGELINPLAGEDGGGGGHMAGAVEPSMPEHGVAASEGDGMDEEDHNLEALGNVILVNGKAWPSVEVEPRKYRFRLLNGSDSRTYNFYFEAAETNRRLPLPKVYQIGTDQGFLNRPQVVRELRLSPGERADVIVDFSNPRLRGKTLILRNNAPDHFPTGDPADSQTVGQVMAFRVGNRVNGRDTSAIPHRLRPERIDEFGRASVTRKLTLLDRMNEHGEMFTQLGTVAGGGLSYSAPATETPTRGNVEVWEIYNTTEIAHPIHLHGTQLQVMNRQQFTATVDPETGIVSNIRLNGPRRQPANSDIGIRDTVTILPGEVVRVSIKFDLAGEFVWHCHMLAHEDNEMMRPIIVTPAPAHHPLVGPAATFPSGISWSGNGQAMVHLMPLTSHDRPRPRQVAGPIRPVVATPRSTSSPNSTSRAPSSVRQDERSVDEVFASLEQGWLALINPNGWLASSHRGPHH